MKFLDKMKKVSLKFHTNSQIHGHFQKRWQTETEFMLYLAKKKRIHSIFNSISLHPKQEVFNFEKEIWSDIQSIDIDAQKDCGSFYSEYLEYLVKTSEMEALLCHYYSFTFAHVSGGGRAILQTAVPILPAGFASQSEYFRARNFDIVYAVKNELEEVTSSWTPQQRLICLKEIPTAFHMNMSLLTESNE